MQSVRCLENHTKSHTPAPVGRLYHERLNDNKTGQLWRMLPNQVSVNSLMHGSVNQNQPTQGVFHEIHVRPDYGLKLFPSNLFVINNKLIVPVFLFIDQAKIG